MRIAIVGPPNAGKSSLLNLLAGHDAAIVSPVAGTTRDLVQVQLELGGNKVRRAPPSPTAWTLPEQLRDVPELPGLLAKQAPWRCCLAPRTWFAVGTAHCPTAPREALPGPTAQVDASPQASRLPCTAGHPH